jgi:hypothetical protein
MIFNLNPKRAFYFLLKLILVLLMFQPLVIFLKLSDVGGIYKNIVYFFDFDWERNLPTFYSALALLTSSILLYIIAVFHSKKRIEHIQWLGLSLIFSFLSLDEMTVIHEQLWAPTQKLFKTSGLLYYAWYIPYGIILLILVVVYAKFIFRLPKNVMYLFILAGFVFVFGAIGIEAVTGWQDELHGQDNLLFYILCTIEELFEMIGVAIFIYGLLTYISQTFGHINFRLS